MIFGDGELRACASYLLTIVKRQWRFFSDEVKDVLIFSSIFSFDFSCPQTNDVRRHAPAFDYRLVDKLESSQFKSNFWIHKSLRYVYSILMNFCVTGVLHTLYTIPGGGFRTIDSVVCFKPVHTCAVAPCWNMTEENKRNYLLSSHQRRAALQKGRQPHSLR